MDTSSPSHEAATGSAASRAIDLGGQAPGAHHRLVSFCRPSPGDIEALLSQAAEGGPVVSQARDSAARLLSRLSVGPWTAQVPEPASRYGADYQVIVVASALRATVRIRCLPRPHVLDVRM